MLYGFIIPVGVIILANAIVFIMVLCNLFRRKTKGMSVNQSERKMAFLHFKAALSIFVVLGKSIYSLRQHCECEPVRKKMVFLHFKAALSIFVVLGKLAFNRQFKVALYAPLCV